MNLRIQASLELEESNREVAKKLSESEALEENTILNERERSSYRIIVIMFIKAR